MGIACVVWSDKERRIRSAEHVHVAKMAVAEAAIRREAQLLAELGPFTHVIAGREESVVPAAIARRVLGVRGPATSTVLRCHDKLKMKNYLASRGVRMTDFLDGDVDLEPEAIVERLGLPIVLKERALGGRRGIEFLPDAAALRERVRKGRLLERFVDAPEVSVESFVSKGQIQLENVTEYARKEHVNIVPARLDDRARTKILDLNRGVLRALKIQRGMTHTEIYVTREGPLFGEIALRPPGGYIMDLLKLAWGFDAWAAFVALELDRPFAFPQAPCAHAASVILHPGEGRVARIDGIESIRAKSSVVDVHIKVRPGDCVAPRQSVGQDVGRVLLRAQSAKELGDAVESVETRLRVELEAP